ncbi:MAG: HDOD domain-containing protein [Gammaproteobacteria bacterium]|nr:HDOD domain-containing protein [Gammaproteobacteria bacterium]
MDSSLRPEDLLSREAELPSAPLIFHRLNELIANPAASGEDFAALVEQDPALTARLLRVVNSPFFGLRQKISSAVRAVNLLGLKELRDLVVATTVIDRFRGFNNTFVSMQGFWQHSLRCAVIAKALLPDSESGDAADSLFVCGLLHEIGHLLLYRQLPELMRQAVLELETSDQPLWQIERRLIGFDYAAVGAALLTQWDMPEGLIIPVGQHPQPDLAQSHQRACALVNLAARLATLDDLEDDKPLQLIPSSDPLWRAAGIQSGNLREVLLKARQRLESTAALLN